jgi:hypothetical protein
VNGNGGGDLHINRTVCAAKEVGLVSIRVFLTTGQNGHKRSRENLDGYKEYLFAYAN